MTKARVKRCRSRETADPTTRYHLQLAIGVVIDVTLNADEQERVAAAAKQHGVSVEKMLSDEISRAPVGSAPGDDAYVVIQGAVDSLVRGHVGQERNRSNQKKKG